MKLFTAILTDINECFEDNIDCGPNAYCQDLEGNYTCECYPGYVRNAQELCDGIFLKYLIGFKIFIHRRLQYCK